MLLSSKAKPENVILCPFDNGIRVMQEFKRGVYGAYKAPEAIYSKLFPKEKVINKIPEVEKLNTKKNEDTYKAHQSITNYISQFKTPFIVLGGDHSITYPIIRGIYERKKYKKIGLIYFDAHYDMRPLEGPNKDVLSSGNSFYRILTDKDFSEFLTGENMVVIGIKKGESEIFKQMEQMSVDKKMTTFYLNEINDSSYKTIMQKAIEIAGKNTEGIYLSFDTDVLDKKYVPGASCPAEVGLELNIAKNMIILGNFIGADIVETSNRELSWKNETDPDGDKKLEISALSDTEIINSINLVE